MSKTPTISVIMSTYNTPKEWLTESIQSILNQTFTDFEFIIVDDCSTESITEVKERFLDQRIIWIANKTNLGLTKSLNKALKLTKGKYIARMDADDISLPERFATQVAFMEEHPEVIVCGSYRQAFGKENKDEIWNIPATREEQQVQLFFFNCGLTHPTAMFRKSMMDEYGITYNENYTKAQDYGIWVQCTRYAPMAMIPKVLLRYRKSEQQISTVGRVNQLENDRKIKLDQLKMIGIDATEEEKELHMAFLMGEMLQEIDKIEVWVKKLIKANCSTYYFPIKCFEKAVQQRWYMYCYQCYKIKKNKKYKKVYYNSITFSLFQKHIRERINVKIVALIRKVKGRI